MDMSLVTLRRRLTNLACAALLAGAAGCADRASSQPLPTEASLLRTISPMQFPQPDSIMPLGDSISDGMEVLGGYRTELWQLLNTDGHSPHFVGSRTAGPAQLGERAFEGHPGWRINQLDARVTDWLKRYRPQVVLLHIGTNDVIQNYHLNTAVARLSALVDHILSAVPGVRVYVATILPFADPVREARAQKYNTGLSQMINARAPGGQVRLVDMHSALTPADLSLDGVHPTEGGYSKMATRWYGALTGAAAIRLEAEDPQVSTVNDGERLPDPHASGNDKVGYLDHPGSYDEFRVTVPADGTSRLYVRAANGNGTWCSQQLSVNGAPTGQVRYPPYGWDQWTITGVDVPLKAGVNTIRLAHQTCSAELDSVDLAPLNTKNGHEQGLFEN